MPPVPIVQGFLNLRYRWAYVFWFTLFHGVAHLLKHKSKRIIVDGEAILDDPPVEEEANRWAADFLIPPEAWQAFVGEDDFHRGNVVQFAKTSGIAPGIVVGRLHEERRLPYAALTDLNPRFQWTGAVSAQARSYRRNTVLILPRSRTAYRRTRSNCGPS